MSIYDRQCVSVACPLVFQNLKKDSNECNQALATCDACSRAYACQRADTRACETEGDRYSTMNYCHSLLLKPEYHCRLGPNPWTETVVCKSEVFDETINFAVVYSE